MDPSQRVSRFEAAQKAINSIGLGFDITLGINFDNCKSIGSPLIFINNQQHCRHLELPGGVTIPNVSNSVKCVRGESIRIHSDVLTLHQVYIYIRCIYYVKHFSIFINYPLNVTNHILDWR